MFKDTQGLIASFAQGFRKVPMTMPPESEGNSTKKLARVHRGIVLSCAHATAHAIHRGQLSESPLGTLIQLLLSCDAAGILES